MLQIGNPNKKNIFNHFQPHTNSKNCECDNCIFDRYSHATRKGKMRDYNRSYRKVRSAVLSYR